MKILTRFICQLSIIGVVAVIWYVNKFGARPETIATTIATVFGFAFTVVGTIIGVIAISKSHKASMRHYELLEKDYNQKLAENIYQNIMMPLQKVINDISRLGDSVFLEKHQIKSDSGDVVVPVDTFLQLEFDVNALKAKLNMTILYADRLTYREIFILSKEMTINLEKIVSSYGDRKWTRETSEGLINAKNSTAKLYEKLIEMIENLNKYQNDA